MEYTPSYLRESFPSAARLLATGEGNACARVLSAYYTIHHLQPERMPEELREDFEWVMHQLTKRDPERKDVAMPDGLFHEEGLVEANLRKMLNPSALKIADRLFTIYEKVLAMNSGSSD